MDRSAFLESLPFLVPASSRCAGIPDGDEAFVRGTTTTTTNASARVSPWPVPKPPPPSRLPAPFRIRPTESHRAIRYCLTEEIMISRLCLSIEPRAMNEGTDSGGSSSSRGAAENEGWGNLGVAFFDAERSGTSSDRQRKQNLPDPALAACEIELSLYECRPTEQQLSRGATQGEESLATAAPPRHVGSGRGNRAPSDPSALLASLAMKINDLVFFVDWTQLTCVRVLEPKNVQRDPASSEPLCLLLYFPGCLFRVFSLGGGDEPLESSDPSPGSPLLQLLPSSADRLRAIQEALDRLLVTSQGASPGFLSQQLHPIAVPRLSEMWRGKETTEMTSSRENGSVAEGSEVDRRKQLDEDGARGAAQHRHKAHQKCLDEIASLSTLLQLGASSTAARRMLANRSGSAAGLGALLTSAAQNLAASYGTPPPTTTTTVTGSCRDEVAAASGARHLECLERRLERTRKQIDDVLDEFFPAPRLRPAAQRPPAKRARRWETAASDRAAEADHRAAGPEGVESVGGTERANAKADDKREPSESSPIRVETRLRQLVHQHKVLVREKHEALGLPTR